MTNEYVNIEIKYMVFCDDEYVYDFDKDLKDRIKKAEWMMLHVLNHNLLETNKMSEMLKLCRFVDVVKMFGWIENKLFDRFTATVKYDDVPYDFEHATCSVVGDDFILVAGHYKRRKPKLRLVSLV